MRTCAVVPTYNHHLAIGRVIGRLREAGLPVFVIDDGSAELTRLAVEAFNDKCSGVIVHHLPFNRGKGSAVIKGFELAAAAGFTHAIQVDADGQHDLNSLPQFLNLAAQYPESVICGRPVYDASVPTGRAIGHWFTNAWIWLETLSLRITDGMCGFRVYPLNAVQAVLSNERVGSGMDFDTEIIVRLFWRGTPVLMAPVRVTYPIGNTSNFKMLADNWRITKMHTRLVCTMLLRLPSILAHRPPTLADTPSHWASLRERGAYWGLRICAVTYRLLGRRVCQALLVPIVLYFYALGAGREQRSASRNFLQRALGRSPTAWDGYRHFFSFANRALDTFAAWVGRIPAEAVTVVDQRTLADAISDPRGAVIVVSHLGNLDLARAVLDPKTRARLTVLVHTRHAVNYNRLLSQIHPHAAMNTIEVTDVGPDTAIELKERVDRGEWVVIAGDRTPLSGNKRVSIVPFLGADAAFSQGPWILGSLMDCPVYLMFCINDGTHYKLTMERFADRIVLSRTERENAIRGYVERYAMRLEHYTKMAPFQWYNFFDFWAH